MSKPKRHDWKREIAPQPPRDYWLAWQEDEHEQQIEGMGDESAQLPGPGRRHIHAPSGRTTAASAKAAGGTTQ